MAIAFKWQNASDNANANTGSSFTVGSTNAAGANGAIAQNDVLIVVINATESTNTDPGAITLSGFTNIYNNYDSAQSLPMRTSVWYKLAGASEPGTYTASWTQAVRGASWALLNYGGVDTSTQVEVSATVNNDSFSTNMVASSVSPTFTNDMLVCVWSEPGGLTTYTVPAGMTSRVNIGSSSSDRPEILVAELQLSASGATGTKTATAGSSTTNAAVTMALKTLSGGGTRTPTLTLMGVG